MTLDMEEEFIGEESHLVPKIDPDNNCNAKKSDRTRENGENRDIFTGYCNNRAGKGTDHVGEGRCKFHGGIQATGPGTGAPAHNQHNLTSATTADPHHYHQNLPPDEKDYIESVSAAICDRVAKHHGREPDLVDRILARRIAIDLHIVSKASDYTKDQLVQVVTHPDGGSHEEKGALVEEVRRFDNSIMQNLKRLGVLEDPDSKKADEMSKWRDFVQEGHDTADDDEVIDIDVSELEEDR